MFIHHNTQMNKASQYVTNHPCQLSLAIPWWVSAVSTSESCMRRKQVHRAMDLQTVVSQCRLVPG